MDMNSQEKRDMKAQKDKAGDGLVLDSRMKGIYLPLYISS